MAEIRVGKRHVKPDTPSHTKGVHEGNRKGAYEKQKGHHEDGTADASAPRREPQEAQCDLADHAEPATRLNGESQELGRGDGMGRRMLLGALVVAVVALFWKELPAMRRYLKMERM